MTTTALPPHNRRLGLVGTELVKARISNRDIEALSEVRDELEAVLMNSGYLDDAPFWWVTIAIRYGLKEDREPHYGEINKTYGDLPLSIEVPIEKLQTASFEQMKKVIRSASIRALVHAGEKFDRPVADLKGLR